MYLSLFLYFLELLTTTTFIAMHQCVRGFFLLFITADYGIPMLQYFPSLIRKIANYIISFSPI